MKTYELDVSRQRAPKEAGLGRQFVEFFDEQKNIRNINCYSNDGGNWKKSELKFENQSLIINFKEPFEPRRGRINCSLNDNGKWRWFGTQFTVKKN